MLDMAARPARILALFVALAVQLAAAPARRAGRAGDRLDRRGPGHGRRPARPRPQGNFAFDHVSSLVTEVGPRLAGSPGDEAAVRWAMNRLGKLGFTGVRTQDVLVPRWVRGTTEVTLLGPAPQPWSPPRWAAASAPVKKASRRK